MDIAEHEIDVWRLDLRIADDALGRLEPTLSIAERARAGRLISPEGQRRAIATKGLSRLVLSGYLDVPPREIAFDFGLYGKPRPAARHRSNLRFNLTDSHDVALIAVSRGRELGIDIEYDKPDRDFRAIVRRRFDPTESAALDTLSDMEARAAFVKAWTRKEAYLKAIGTGMRGGLSSFTVSILPTDPPRIVRCAEPGRWTVFPIDVPHGFAATLVAEKGESCTVRMMDSPHA